MLHWMQYLRGYVKVKVWGYSTERLLNLCGNHDILVWDIADHGGYTTMNVSVRGFFALKPLLKKTGTRASVLQKYGLPFFMSKMQRRKIFAAGFVCCMVFWILMSRFLWNIRIEGNYMLTEDVLLAYLREQGVSVPMPKNRLQIAELEKALREDYDLITWTSARLEGTTLLVQIKENEMPDYEPQEEDAGESAGTDLVARRAGTVAYIVTRSGVPQVEAGDEVKAGDVLVSGAVPVYNEDNTVRRYRYVQSDADITLRYTDDISVKRDVMYDEKIYTGRRKKILTLGFYDREWDLKLGRIKYEDYDVSGEKTQVRLLDQLYLPFYYGTKTVQEYRMARLEYTEDEMEGIMRSEWNKIITTLEEKGVQITEKNVTIKKNETYWVLNAALQLEEAAVRTAAAAEPADAGETADTEP